MKRHAVITLCLVALLTGCQTAPRVSPQALARARVDNRDGLPVVHLSGTPYEIGYQHGTVMREEVREHYARTYRYLTSLPTFRLFTRWQVNWYLDRVWSRIAPHIPKPYLEEMRGLSDASGVPLADVYRVHAIPDAHPTSCSVGVFWGAATVDGRMYQLRNLDWNRRFGVHEYGCVFVVSPEGKNRFVNLGFVGFIGALSGLNEKGIAIGQIGSRSADESYDGVPFIFLLRRILEEASGVEDAEKIVRDVPRTVGINYVIGSALEKRAVAMETTAKHFASFHDADPDEAKSEYAVPLTNAVFRADTAFDPVVRNLQTCSDGDPKVEGLEDPRRSSAHKKRYLGQADMVRQEFGRIGTNEVFAVTKRVAMKSNIQSVVYAFPEFWVAYAKGEDRAVDVPYHHFHMDKLLGK